MRSFSVGDKVRVRRDLDVKSLRAVPPCFTQSMDQYLGAAGEVISSSTLSNDWVGVDIVGDSSYFRHEWLEPADTPDAPTTTPAADGLEAVRESLVAKLREATPATLIPVAEALGMRVRESITYSLVPRDAAAKGA